MEPLISSFFDLPRALFVYYPAMTQSHSAMTPEMRAHCAAVTRRFLHDADITHLVPYGSGHINDTFRVRLDENGTSCDYILQRINTAVFTEPEKMMENIVRVTGHLQGMCAQEKSVKGFVPLTPVKDASGAWCFADDRGDVWRVYHFVHGTYAVDVAQSARQAYEAARLFGHFQELLCGLPAPRLHETIRDFHNTAARVRQLEVAIARDAAGRVDAVADDIAFARARASLADTLPPLVASGEIPEREIGRAHV